MSNRCLIGIQTNVGFEFIDCLNGGNLYTVGNTLINYYNNKQLVQQLINNRSLTTLENNIKQSIKVDQSDSENLWYVDLNDLIEDVEISLYDNIFLFKDNCWKYLRRTCNRWYKVK